MDMNDSESKIAPALVEGRDRTGPFVILCDHASNRFPEKYSGISEYEMLAKEHVSWDPGALPSCAKIGENIKRTACVFDCIKACY